MGRRCEGSFFKRTNLMGKNIFRAQKKTFQSGSSRLSIASRKGPPLITCLLYSYSSKEGGALNLIAPNLGAPDKFNKSPGKTPPFKRQELHYVKNSSLGYLARQARITAPPIYQQPNKIALQSPQFSSLGCCTPIPPRSFAPVYFVLHFKHSILGHNSVKSITTAIQLCQ